MKEYVTVGNTEVVYETVIDKSRFIAAAVHVDDMEQAVRFVESKRKQFYDATHNCYSYIVGDKAKFSDDGEPQGTAGMPIYECIKQNGLDYICVVVTRYFGGIKLGACIRWKLRRKSQAGSSNHNDGLHACSGDHRIYLSQAFAQGFTGICKGRKCLLRG